VCTYRARERMPSKYIRFGTSVPVAAAAVDVAASAAGA